MDKQEFIKRYHITEVLKFEPPTFEEFLETRTDDLFAHWFYGDISIVMSEENHEKGIMHCPNGIEVSFYDDWDKDRCFSYYNEYGFDNREETYYKAVEYAKKYFLGEIQENA